MKKRLTGIAAIAAILYPFIIYILLKRYHANPRILVIAFLAMGITFFLSQTNKRQEKGIDRIKSYLFLLLILLISIATIITDNLGYIKMYPVIINCFLSISFISTLFIPPNMIFRFALVQDKSLEKSPNKGAVEKYCMKVTYTWITFFIVNGIIAFITAFFTSDFVWTIYNGLISYLLIGSIFLIELIIRKRNME